MAEGQLLIIQRAYASYPAELEKSMQSLEQTLFCSVE